MVADGLVGNEAAYLDLRAGGVGFEIVRKGDRVGANVVVVENPVVEPTRLGVGNFLVHDRLRITAHLDVGGARGQAIRRALHDQLGLAVEDVEPFGLAGSAGSTPLRIKVAGDPDSWLFGKLYARNHLRADRWYKLGRELLYGRLEDEKPFVANMGLDRSFLD